MCTDDRLSNTDTDDSINLDIVRVDVLRNVTNGSILEDVREEGDTLD
jgi:hypothetical protein